jgi:hypothetical protein
MAVADTYIIKSATWKSVAINGLEDVKWSEEGDVVSHNSDGQVTVGATFIDNIKGKVTITTRNASIATTANYAIGSTGALVFVMQKRQAGKGAVNGQDKTCTSAEATLINVSGNAPHADRGSVDLEFEIADADGAAPFAWS